MAATVIKSPNYPAIFHSGIMRATQHLLARIQQLASYLLPSKNVREQVLHTLTFALIWDDTWPVARDLLLQIASKMEQAGYRKEWMVYLEGGIEQSQKLGDVEAEAELRFHLGVLYQRLAQYDEARCQHEFSAAYFEKVGNSYHQARALNRLATVARRQQRFEEATELVQRALSLSQEGKEEIAYSYLVLGTIAFDQRDWQNAYDLLSKSLALWEESDNQRMIAWGLTNFGMVLSALKRYDEAIACYARAISLFEAIQDPAHLATARMNLGNVYLQLGRFTDALDLYLEAEPTFRRTQDRLRLAMVNNNKGMAYQKLEQWDKAKHAYLFSIELWRELGNIGLLVNVMDNLGLVYSNQGLYNEARVTFQDPLDKLAQIKHQHTYDYLFTMVSTHLQEAMTKNVDENPNTEVY